MAKGSGGIGGWAFIIGVIVAVLLGLFGGALNQLWMGILVVIGLIVGFLNVSSAESTDFLLSSVALVIVASLGSNALSSINVLSNVLNAIMALVVPATVIVALKSIYSLAKN